MTAPLSLAEVTALIDEQIKANTAGFVSLAELTALIDERIAVHERAGAVRRSRALSLALRQTVLDEAFEEQYRKVVAKLQRLGGAE